MVSYVNKYMCLKDLFIQVNLFSLPTLGPRFVLNLIKVFEGSFGGSTLYENPKYVTPNAVSRMLVLKLPMINDCFLLMK